MKFNGKLSRDRDETAQLNKILVASTILIGVLIGFILILFFTWGSDVEILPPPKQATVFYDINQKEYTRIYLENRLETPLRRIPDYLKKAIINVEDARFFDHSGFDPRAIARALWVDIKGGGYIEGGSTITQQLARNILLTQKKMLTRKIQEVFLAMKIERNYTKEEILERYLNQIYFGHGAYGVEAASRMYFGKSVTELQLHQMALLAGLPKNPNGFSPYINPQAAKKRRGVVLGQMVKYGSITPTQAAYYQKKPLDVIPQSASGRKAAYFIDYVVKQLHDIINEEMLYTGGYQIYTTLDPLAQQAAEAALATLTGGSPDSKGILQPQAALVALDPRTGFIKAMIGGRDFANTQLNRAAMAHRQPGSAIKPFVYTAAIDSREFTPSSVLADEPLSYPSVGGPWKPQNYDHRFRGYITLRQALEESVNIIAIKLVERLGPSKVVRYAKMMGLQNLVVTGSVNDLNLASLALGGLTKGVSPLELAAAYTPLANQGIRVDPVAVLEVKDADGNTIYEDRPHKKVALAEDTAYLVTDMLRGVIIRGTGRGAMIDRPAAGKTGTSSDYTNAWFVGYTPDLLATVWIGNDTQKLPVKIDGAYVGSGRAAQIWGRFMQGALVNTPPSDFAPPSGITTGIEICADSGQRATPNCGNIIYETFLKGTEPTEYCRIHGAGYLKPNNSNGSASEPVGHPSVGQPQPAGENSPPQSPSGSGAVAPKPLPTPAPKKRKVVVKICTESGLLATPYCPESVTVSEIFVEGEEPKGYCNIHKGN